MFYRHLAKTRNDPENIQFIEHKRWQLAIVFNISLIVIAIILAWWALANIKVKLKEEMRDSLQTVLNTTHEALDIWVNDQIQELNTIATDPRISEHALELLSRYKRGLKLVDHDQLLELRVIFSDLQLRAGHIGFFIVAPDGTNIASMRDENIGGINLIQEQRADLLSQVFAGESVLVPPIVSDVPLEGVPNVAGSDRPPTMFFAAPIKDLNGNVIAALTERYEPRDNFSRINQLGRIGSSGETYLFDRQGKLLSESRFVKQLISIGMLKPNEQGILSLKVSNPGGNLIEGFKTSLSNSERPLTRMAENATKGESGYDVDGYRDYRGVPVMGAWLWDGNLGFGMTTEIDVDEALNAYNSARLMVVVIIGITVLVSIAFTLLIMHLGSQASKSLKMAHDRLEERVKKRTKELSDAKDQVEKAMVDLEYNESRYASLVSNIPGAVYRCDLDENWTMRYLSNYIEQLTGYPPSDFIENKIRSYASIIHPEDT